MIALYRLLVPFIALFALPLLWLQAKRRGGYGGQGKNLFGCLPTLDETGKTTTRFWVQAASVGELLAAEPLIHALAKTPHTEVVLTTTTATGLRVAGERFGREAAFIGVFPLDIWPISVRAWKRLRPDVVILIESELWPEHMRQAQLRRVPLYLVNARMSERSFRRYRRLRRAARPLLRPLRAVLAATESDKRRFAKLGLGIPVVLTGSLKFDFDPQPYLDPAARMALLRECGLVPREENNALPPPPVILGASTWTGEERTLLAVFARLRVLVPGLKLILVPRHAERSEEIERSLAPLVEQHPVLQPRFRASSPIPAPECLVYVADTTGELRRFIQAATVVFVGRSLPPHTDGQSPIEAAAYGKPILMGPGMRNFTDVAEELVRRGAAVSTPDARALEASLRKILLDTDLRKRLGKSGQDWFVRNRGSVERTLKHLLTDTSTAV